jgi:ABC-type glycerol-3-phosphate transport system substrate-binding protein
MEQFFCNHWINGGHQTTIDQMIEKFQKKHPKHSWANNFG